MKTFFIFVLLSILSLAASIPSPGVPTTHSSDVFAKEVHEKNSYVGHMDTSAIGISDEIDLENEWEVLAKDGSVFKDFSDEEAIHFNIESEAEEVFDEEDLKDIRISGQSTESEQTKIESGRAKEDTDDKKDENDMDSSDAERDYVETNTADHLDVVSGQGIAEDSEEISDFDDGMDDEVEDVIVSGMALEYKPEQLNLKQNRLKNEESMKSVEDNVILEEEVDEDYSDDLSFEMSHDEHGNAIEGDDEDYEEEEYIGHYEDEEAGDDEDDDGGDDEDDDDGDDDAEEDLYDDEADEEQMEEAVIGQSTHCEEPTDSERPILVEGFSTKEDSSAELEPEFDTERDIDFDEDEEDDDEEDYFDGDLDDGVPFVDDEMREVVGEEDEDVLDDEEFEDEDEVSKTMDREIENLKLGELQETEELKQQKKASSESMNAETVKTDGKKSAKQS